MNRRICIKECITLAEIDDCIGICIGISPDLGSDERPSLAPPSSMSPTTLVAKTPSMRCARDGILWNEDGYGCECVMGIRY